MSRLRRFEDHRFVGDRRTMKVYDCDDPGQFEIIEELAAEHDLVRRNLIQTFAPDDPAEAANRGFGPHG